MLKAFDDLLKGDTSDGQPKTEGNDKKNGVKGDEDGNPKSSKYYGNQGSDNGDPNYNLLGREALKKLHRTTKLPRRRNSCGSY